MASEGEKLRAAGDKKAAGTGGLFGRFGGGPNYDAARDDYVAAGNQFKIAKMWKESGDCFCKAAEMAIKDKQPNDAANDFWTASKSYKKTHPELAVVALQKTIGLYKSEGKFRQAADREKEIATILATEGGDLQGALEAFENAGDLYSSEDASATANSCYKEAAEIAATLGQYPRAVKHFEAVAKASLSSALTRYSTKDYYMKAGLCLLASGDVVSTQRALNSYVDQDPSFAQTREAKFIVALTDAFDQNDVEGFTAQVADYDRLTKLDNWKTGILLTIKRQIAEEPSLT